MDPADVASAIDDSYEAIHFHPGRPSVPGPGGPPVTQENFGYNAPRSGHWTVKDTVVGSGIDDGCPTVHHFPATKYDITGHVQPLAGGMVRRLAKATEDQKQAEDEDGAADGAKAGAGSGEKETQVQAQASEKPNVPTGFFVPKNDMRGIRITSKNGRNEVVKPPQITPLPATVNKEKPISKEDKANETQARAPSPQPSANSQSAATVISHKSQQSKRAVRITSKSGEEVFTYLPVIPAGSKPASRTPSATKEEKTGTDEVQAAKDDKAEKAQRDANAAKIAKQLREVRARQTQIDEQRAKDAKIAAEAMMSGALPASEKAFSARSMASVPSGKSSGRDSGVAFGRVSKNSSKAPSVASSKTSVPQSQKAASVESAAQSSQRVVSVKLAAQATQKPSSEQSEAQSRPGWQEGLGTVDAAPSKSSHRSASAQSWEAKGATPVHSFHAACEVRQSEPGSVQDDRRSASHLSNNSKVSSTHQPTIFAGRGWISPHPLSRPPSEFEQPPDPAIKIPSRSGTQEGATMTYDEWMKIQQSGEAHSVKVARCNFSRTSSDAERYAGGSWGFRSVKAAEPVREEEWGGRYQSPAIESVRSGETYEHDFDGVKEWDGKTHLRMPWDDQRGW